MNRLFGAPKVVEKPVEQKAPVEVEQKVEPPVIDLTEQSKRMENRVKEIDETIKGLEAEIADLYQKAKNSRGSSQKMYKQRCLNLAKKKKLYENQMAGFLNQQFTLDQIAFTKENIQNTLEMSSAMKQAVVQQKQLFEQVNLDELEDLRDEMDEMVYETDYMNDMLNRNYAMDVNEQDLDDEFAELDNQIFAEQMMNNARPNINQQNNQSNQYNQQVIQQNQM